MIVDAVVVGGGFYGAAVAVYLVRQRGFRAVVLFEGQDRLLGRASYNNQARIHNGYHYPRSFTTAFRSRVNFPRFVTDHPAAVYRDFPALYAIARQGSKVTARQFARFCRGIGAPLAPAPATLLALFEPRLIEEVFLVEERAFDATALAAQAEEELRECQVDVRLGSRVEALRRRSDGRVEVAWRAGETEGALAARYVFNCTYSGLNQHRGDYTATVTGLKHEITEMALMEVPSELRDVGITVMDGPFFSLMPFPARSLHSLSHVRYTPHLHWPDEPGVDPYARLATWPKDTRSDRMVREASRYLPVLRTARRVDSLFEVKTVLVKNEVDDGRPILFERHPTLPGCFSILGGKIDNVYDVLEKLDALQLPLGGEEQ